MQLRWSIPSSGLLPLTWLGGQLRYELILQLPHLISGGQIVKLLRNRNKVLLVAPPPATLDDVDAATARTPNYQRIVNFFSRTDPNQPSQAQQDQMSDFYQQPDVRQQIASTPGLADQVLKDKYRHHGSVTEDG